MLPNLWPSPHEASQGSDSSNFGINSAGHLGGASGSSAGGQDSALVLGSILSGVEDRVASGSQLSQRFGYGRASFRVPEA